MALAVGRVSIPFAPASGKGPVSRALLPVHGGRLEDCLYHCYRTESGTNSRVQESIRTHEKRWHLRTSTVSHGKGIRSASTPSARGIEPNQEDKSAGSPPSLSKKRGNSIRLCLVFHFRCSLVKSHWSGEHERADQREACAGTCCLLGLAWEPRPGARTPRPKLKLPVAMPSRASGDPSARLAVRIFRQK